MFQDCAMMGLLPIVFKGTQQLDIKALLARRDLNAIEEHELEL